MDNPIIKKLIENKVLNNNEKINLKLIKKKIFKFKIVYVYYDDSDDIIEIIEDLTTLKQSLKRPKRDFFKLLKFW